MRADWIARCTLTWVAAVPNASNEDWAETQKYTATLEYRECLCAAKIKVTMAKQLAAEEGGQRGK